MKALLPSSTFFLAEKVFTFLFVEFHQVKAMLESSVRRLCSGSSAYTIGWFGTWTNMNTPMSQNFRFHLEKSSGYKPVGGSNFSGNQHVVVGEIRGKVILVVPV